MNITTLPPGKYFIGDPGYVFDTDWNNGIIEVILKGGTEFKGKKFFAHSTVNGDGCFNGSNGFMFGVDSCHLGAIPIELFTKSPELEGDEADGIIVDAPEGMSCSYEDGVFHFVDHGARRTITIDTNGDDLDDEDTMIY